MGFEGSSLWRVRQKIGHDLILWPGATVLVEDPDGRVLLGLRGDNGEWAMPGGADLIAFACVSDPDDHVVRYPGGDVTHYFGIWFVLRRWEGEPAADGEELLEVRWFDRDDLPAPLMHSSAVAFAHYARYLETGAFQVG